MNHETPHVVVCGLGRSGEAAARMLRGEGARVTVIDEARGGALARVAEGLRKEGVDVRLGVRDLPDEAFTAAVLSPGLPVDHPWPTRLRAAGVPAHAELEWGWLRRTCPCLAVTGSSGKSTLVKLLAEAIEQAGLRAAPLGNYGTPVCEAVAGQPRLDGWVVEVSSFQLEAVERFCPEIGILLNLQPNHLDRHPDMAAYSRAKARLFDRMDAGQTAIVHDQAWARIRTLTEGHPRWVSMGLSEGADYRWTPGALRHDDRVFCIENTRFDNPVLGQAAAAAWAAFDAAGWPLEALERALRAFRPLPHRMTELGVWEGRAFIDDSKATNLEAMLAALRMCPPGVRLIAGGRPKESDFGPAQAALTERVRGAYLIGEAAEDMKRAWAEATACALCGSIEEAVDQAIEDSLPGETVLLSPACASFDQFAGYAERGERFRKRVELRMRGEA